MIELKTGVTKEKFELDDEVCASFQKKIIFNSVPNLLFYDTFCILDFANKELTLIKTDLEENIQKIGDRGLLSAAHSVTALNDKGFYVFSTYDTCFRYFHYETNTMKVIFGSDLNHPDSNMWSEVSASFKKPDDGEYLLLGFMRTDDRTVDIVKVDENLNAEKLLNISLHIAPHEVIKFHDFCMMSDFSPTVKFENLSKFIWSSNGEPKKNNIMEREDVENEFGSIDLMPDYIKVVPDKIYSYNIKIKELKYYDMDDPPSAHFEFNEENVYVSSHNMYSYDGFYYFMGPAKITKWNITDGQLKKQNSFQNNEIFRCFAHKYIEFENKSYIVSLGHPNRIIYIDADTMELVWEYNINDDILSGHQNPTTYVNTLHRMKHPSVKDISPDVNVSTDGRYSIYFDNSKVGFVDFKNKRNIDQFINYPIEPEHNKNRKFKMHSSVLI